MPKLPTYRVRPFRAGSDLDAVMHLYVEHGGAYLPVPDPDDLLEAADDGMLFVAAEGADARKSKALGVAGLFRMVTCEGPNGQLISVYEMAGMVLAPPLRRCGLQPLMLALRALTLARGASTNTALVASVVAGNTRSLTNLENGGFVRCESPGWLRMSHRSWNLGTADVIDLVMPPRAVQGHARLLADALSNPVQKRKADDGGPSAIRVEFDIAWLGGEPDILRDYQAGQIPAWEVAIPTIRLVGTDPDWVRFKPQSN